jgi:hypothetical protein
VWGKGKEGDGGVERAGNGPRPGLAVGKKNKKDGLVMELGYIREKRDFQKNKPLVKFK